jgi:hypothetical protein
MSPVTAHGLPPELPLSSTHEHVTGGLEARIFAFHMSGHERRVSVSLAGEIASRYKNAGLSFGFWN